ncbi:MAG: sigma-54-dependent Fis family transcriptional regulator [Polyangiaceae bacterium]|nr:sigma-54-dependent Fis family transcriptional regulator [Polyangiaceae bacterium]
MSAERKQLLVVDDEPNLRRVLSAQLTRDGYDVHTAEDGEQGLQMLADHHFDLVISDLKMPKVDGMQLLREASVLEPQLPVVIITAHGTVDNAVEALKTGAFDYITKPFDQDEVRMVVRKALRVGDLSQIEATHVSADNPETRFGIIGTSAPIRELYDVLERVVDTPSTVLLTGESGTGKEVVARALHEHSSRRHKPFIKVNCAAIPRDLMESELFGHERGAFTGAVAAKPGRFELANGGTLFLDEIGTIPVDMQVKLLRVLQEREFERVGGVRTYKVNVRLVAATNTDLKQQIAAGAFREDLYYRLNVVPLPLAPLRERADDILLLAKHFTKKYSEALGKVINGMEPAVAEILLGYSWPGNIRELENVIERSVLFCDTPELSVDNLPPDIRQDRSPPAGQTSPGVGLKAQVKAATSVLERELIVRALEQTHNNVTHAARLLKISRKGLQLKMKELELRERSD